MTLSAYDSSGYLGDVASTGGWGDFTRWALKEHGEIAAFIKRGWSEKLSELSEQLKAIPKGGASVDGVRDAVLHCLARAKDIIVISDGVGSEQVEDVTHSEVTSKGWELARAEKGGAGSGNFGHGGRPGEVGGSSSEGGGAESSTSPSGSEKQRNDYVHFNTPDEIDSTLETQSLTPDQTKTLRQYAGTTKSYGVNKYLRTGKGTEAQKRIAEEVGKLLDSSHFPIDAQVARSINPGSADERTAILDSLRGQVGETFSDPAFMSTSANAEYARKWGEFNPVRPIRVTVLVPKGAKAMYVPKGTTKKHEWEVLIQKGSRFRVHSVDASNNVTLEIVP